jgi:hypothetical protein
MNTIELIKHDMAGMRRMVNMTMENMTAELFNWAPPGTANTISATFVHFINTEDNFVHKVIQGKPSVWENGGWSQKTGVQKLPSIGEDWSYFKHQQIVIQPLLEYMAAVWADTDAYLENLQEAELDRKVKFAGGERSVADMLLMAASQSLSHNGEIAALKGIQGVKGLSI